MPDIACVNGRFSPLSEAVVSVEDRGFQFGDGVYEVVRTYGNRPFQLDAHLIRLEKSAGGLNMKMPASRDECSALIREAVSRAAHKDSKIYIQVTRGVAPRDHQFPVDAVPTLVITVREMRTVADSLRRAGAEAITLDDFRWGRCDIKSVNLLANVLARQQAREAGVFEAIFIRHGEVLEGSVSNVFAVQNGELLTAPEGRHILSGVTRSLVLNLAREAGVPVHERAPLKDSLYAASEVFLSGTTIEVLPLTRLDGRIIGTGLPGPITRLLSDRFEKLVS
ncbi:MAG TPA: D-amino-acid transaminase [Nitrospiraceae bacterium]|nr:D-amino-acid transaminase [Nitrospiraceae bacterium]